MSSVKISGLNASSNLNANPAHSIFPTTDVDTGQTTKIDAKSLGTSLYSNNTLIVGSGGVVLPNIVAQFTGTSSYYTQVNEQNIRANGTADYIVTADIGTDVSNYIDLGFTNSAYNNTAPLNSLGTSIEPLSGYLYVQGDGTTGNGNFVLGTLGAGTETRFVVGGGNTNNIIAKVNTSGVVLLNSKKLYFTDGTSQNTAAAPYAVSNTNASNIANNAANIAILQANVSTINSYAYSTNTWIQGHYLANATGTLAGDLTITGNVNIFGANVNLANSSLNSIGSMTVNGTMLLSNSNFTSTQSALTISASPTVATPSNDGYMIHISGKQNVSSRIVADSYGANTYVVIAGRSSRGTVASPSAVQNNDVLMRISGNGYGTTGFAPLGVGRIDIVATENFTDSARGSQIQFFNTVAGTNTLNQIATFNASDVTFTGEVNPQKGFVLTPNVIPGIITSLSIDIANTSLFKFSTNATATISLSGFKTGKIVEVWLQNTDNNNHSITHGCLANNSTVGSTSFNLTAGRAAYIKYFSIDGDLANTYCNISYS